MGFYSSLYNALVNELGVECEKYEREDAYFGILEEVKKGRSIYDACREVLNTVHGIDLRKDSFDKCYQRVTQTQK